MLQQERISLIALSVSVLGAGMLLFLSEAIEATEVKIGEIDERMLEWPVAINAKIVSSYQRNNVAVMELYDGTGKIKAVLFSPSSEQQALLSKDSFASFKGKVELYREELEIVVERVEPWR